MSVFAEVRHTLWPGPGDRHGPLSPVLVVLTVVTGLVDAVSYLKLGHVFVANMTGNVVFLGFAIAGASGLSTASSLVAIGAFLLGGLAGGWIGNRHGDHRGLLLRTAGVAQVPLMALALALAAIGANPPDRALSHAIVACLAAAMGIQNAATLRLSVPDLTTTVLTRLITGLASEASWAGGDGSRPGRRGIAVGAMLLGALTGALLALKVSIAAALALALTLVLATSVAMHLASRAEAAWTRA